VFRVTRVVLERPTPVLT